MKIVGALLFVPLAPLLAQAAAPSLPDGVGVEQAVSASALILYFHVALRPLLVRHLERQEQAIDEALAELRSLVASMRERA